MSCRLTPRRLVPTNIVAGYAVPRVAVRKSTPIIDAYATSARVKFVRVRVAPPQLVYHNNAPVKLASVKSALRKSVPLRLRPDRSTPCKSHPAKLLFCVRTLQSLLATAVPVGDGVSVSVGVRVSDVVNVSVGDMVGDGVCVCCNDM